MSIPIKLLITFVSISMFSALAYAFVYGAIIGIRHMNIAVFLLLWLGPLGLAIAIGGPIALYHMWTGL